MLLVVSDSQIIIWNELVTKMSCKHVIMEGIILKNKNTDSESCALEREKMY